MSSGGLREDVMHGAVIVGVSGVAGGRVIGPVPSKVADAKLGVPGRVFVVVVLRPMLGASRSARRPVGPGLIVLVKFMRFVVRRAFRGVGLFRILQLAPALAGRRPIGGEVEAGVGEKGGP